jgi:amino acid transporter
MFAANLALQNIASRYTYALGRDNVLPAVLGRAHPIHGSPSTAAAAVAAILLCGAAIPAVLGVDTLMAYTTLTGLGCYALLLLMTVTAVAIVVFFARSPRGFSHIRGIVFPGAAVIGLVIVLVMATRNRAALVGGNTTVGTICIAAIASIGAVGW